MSFTLTENPQFYGLEKSLSNILMIYLFRSNNRMVIFLKQKKKSYHSKHVRDHTFTTSLWKGDGRMGQGLKICHMSAYSFVFKRKIYCSFFQMKGLGCKTWVFTELVIFCWRHKFMTPKWFKNRSNSIIRGSRFFFSIKPQARYILAV